MTSSSTGRRLRDAAVLGVATGLRSMTPIAVLAARNRLGGSPAGRAALIAAGGGELLADKLPGVPPRTAPPVLGGRIAAGAFVGARVAGPLGAATGAVAAAAGAVGATRLRAAIGRSTALPDPLLGAVEDVLAVGAAVAATRSAT